MVETKKGSDKDRKKTTSGTIMTHLMSYSTPSESEYRLHDAEYLGRHYFDFRKYEQKTRGVVPTRNGVRLNSRYLEFLEDAMQRWRRFYKQIVVKEAKPSHEMKTSQEEENQRVTENGTVLTHLMTYSGPRGVEYRLYDSEYKGEHYFDFGKYESNRRGSGIRLNSKLLEFLENAMMRWRRFYKQVVVSEAKRTV